MKVLAKEKGRRADGEPCASFFLLRQKNVLDTSYGTVPLEIERKSISIGKKK